MEMTKSKILQIVIGSVSLVMLVLSILGIGGILPVTTADWNLGVVCLAIVLVGFGFIMVEVILYFLLAKSDVMALICKWILIFFGVIVLVINTVIFATMAPIIFGAFGTFWFSFVYALLTYALCGVIIAYLVISGKEEKAARLEKRNEEPVEPVK